MNNVHTRSTNHTMRIPIIIDADDMKDPGGTLKRYTDKRSPGQSRFYCKPATSKMKCEFMQQGFRSAAMSPNQQIGENTIATMLKTADVRVGHDITGHGNRCIFVSTLVNDPGVSIEESLASARHSSVSAQRAYVVRDGRSEAAKFNALGLHKKNQEE